LLHYKDREYLINNKNVGKVTQALYNHLVDIQYGRAEDKYNWVYELGRK